MTRLDQDHAACLDSWPKTLLVGLHSILDVEAGLREVLLHSHYAAQLDGLAAILDVEAGLGQILLTKISLDAAEQEEGCRPAIHQVFQSVDPGDRLALRQRSDVRTAHRLLGCALDHDHALGFSLHLARELTRYVDHNRAPDDEDAFAHELPRARALAHDLAVRLDADCGRATGLAHALTRSASLRHVPVEAIDLAHAFDHARTFNLVLDLAHTLDRDLDGDLARQLVRCLARDLCHIREFARALVALAVTWAEKAIGNVLGRAVRLGEGTVNIFLDDFTTSDLRLVRLSEVDLEGVRWSETGTRWPDEVDVERLKDRSDEIEVGSGLWVVRSGFTTVRDFADC